MAKSSIIYHSSMLLLIIGCSLHEAMEIFDDGRIEYMSREERDTLKQEAKDMFFHAYNAYMNNAYPADELMPLSCKGRYRGSEPDRGDIDSTLGNFSLTLVDTLDTLVVMGDIQEFENAVKLVIKDVTFDTDVIVSLFETNIRMLGGLLSSHILADYIQQRANALHWYRGELLNLARDLGYRFLPAFNTTTGIPFGRINLKYGMKGVPLDMMRETCTACAGSMILEMAALSRLTGESIFEEKAHIAMDALWKLRHRGTDLMGSVLNVNSGDWVRRDAGVGAGIDSYYEYCLKAYILLGDEKYLGRFNKHYQAIMKYISQGPMLLDVHMHRPQTNSKNFMDALLAFWPGLQVLKGDIKPAVETHEMLYQVMQRHNFIPEAFTTDFQVHWGHHPLRPEFLESTYFLYKATGDHYYLGVGRKVLKSLQTYARVPCGFAAVSDVRTNKHDDTMDSFVLSETFKYLFLLFADSNDLLLDLDEYVFTTEGHLLPLSLASVRTNTSLEIEKERVFVEETDRTCPNSVHLFPATVRQPLRNMVEDVCPRRLVKKRLSAVQFQPRNLEHAKILSEMGISILTLGDGSVQLLHTYSNAKTPQDAEEGLVFMQEMVELSKMQNQEQETRPVLVTFTKPSSTKNQTPQQVTLTAGPAQFGPDMKNKKVTAKVVLANPSLVCEEVNTDLLKGMIVIVDRGSCMFIDKARYLQKAGALGGIVLDNVPGSSIQNSRLFAMSGDGKQSDDITIPFVFLFSVEASQLLQAIVSAHGSLSVTIGPMAPKDEAQLKAPTDMSMLERIKGTLKEILSRQLTSQNFASTGSEIDEAAKNSAFNQDQITYAHLRATVVGDSSEKSLKIDLNTNVDQLSFKVSNDIPPNFNEINWALLKKLLVNELFGTIQFNLGIMVPSSSITNVYSSIMRNRGVDDETIKNTSWVDQVTWFLKELAEVRPDPPVVSLFFQLYPEIKKQYLLSNLFRNLASTMEKLPEINKSLKSGNLDVPSLSKSIVDKYNSIDNKSPHTVEYEKFLEKYLPTVISYILDTRLNLTSKNNTNTDTFSINEFINAGNNYLMPLFNPEKVFPDVSGKKKMNTTHKNENVIKDKVKTTVKTDNINSSALNTDTIDGERNFNEESKTLDNNNKHFSVKRMKGDVMEDNDDKSAISEVSEDNENEKIVPINPIQNSVHSSSVDVGEIPSKGKDSDKNNFSVDREKTVGEKNSEDSHVHDDL